MQLHLETEELDLIANVLMDCESRQMFSTKGAAPGRRSVQDFKMYEELLDRVLRRDQEFDSEEFQALSDILTDQKRLLQEKFAQEPRAEARTALQKRLEALEPVLQRVEEACVMF